MMKAILQSIVRDSFFRKRITHVEVLPKRKAKYGSLSKPLPISIEKYLEKQQIQLYTHQCETIEHVRRGKNVVLTTETASGKTLAFTLPVMERMYYDNEATALFIYPTKALANDQVKTVQKIEWETGIEVSPGIYDGDISKEEKREIRRSSRVVISNPYELHFTLAWHKLWERFYRNIKYVVIDEAHVYRGVFGSNIAFVLWRLLRICRYYDSDPQIIISTATLANPLQFSEMLVDKSFELVKGNGAPRGKKYFVCYNPFYSTDPYSVLEESEFIFSHLVERDVQTLCFTSTRKMAELISVGAKRILKERSLSKSMLIASYRAGYAPHERRKLENALRTGELRGIVSTNALEVGIDVGSLDAVVMAGYPGTLISLWQQAGRAGRRDEDSVVIFVAFDSPLDQYFVNNSKVMFERSIEHAIIDLTNPYICRGQLLCACYELPINEEDLVNILNDKLRKAVVDNLKHLLDGKIITKNAQGITYRSKDFPAFDAKLNNMASETFQVKRGDRFVENLDRHQVYREAYPGAVMYHQGHSFVVEDLDLRTKTVQVVEKRVNYVTSAIKSVKIQEMRREKKNRLVGYGSLRVVETYYEYQKKRGGKTFETGKISLPSLKFETKGLWIKVPEEVLANFEDEEEEIIAGLQGVRNALLSLLPIYVMCARWDVHGIVSKDHNTGQPKIYLYDIFDGGIGLTEKAYTLMDEILTKTYELVNGCKCKNGCPACILVGRKERRGIDKVATINVLKSLVMEANKAKLSKEVVILEKVKKTKRKRRKK